MGKTMVNGARAALLVLFGLGLALLPTAAPAADGLETPKQCLITTCVVSTVAPSPNGWNLNLKITMWADRGYKFFSLRVPGNEQMKVDGPGNVAEVDLPVSAGWDGNFQARACNADLLSERCDSWSTFHAELPVAADDQNFCIGYADIATSAAQADQQQNCGLDSPPGRWSTDNSLHLNWCLGQFRGAGGVANKLVAARNLANSEEAARTGGLEACQVNSAAAAADKKAYTDERADEMQVTGKTLGECQNSNQRCEARFGGAPGGIATQCAPYLQLCIANAAAALAAPSDDAAVPPPDDTAGTGEADGGGGDIRTVGANGTTVYKDAGAQTETGDYLQPGDKVTVVDCPNGDTGACQISKPVKGFVDGNDLT